jgi:peptidoglycan hydrolase-like protein with peptidoglycan-binding domain
VRRFQCAEGIVCDGSPETTGYGAVGPRTRERLNALIGAHPVPLPPAPAPSPSPSAAPATAAPFTRNLSVGDRGEDVRSLQRFLNARGHTIAAVGPGSPGNETEYYGERTRDALARFQEAYAEEILVPVGLERGTGFFGPGTARKVRSLLGTLPSDPLPAPARGQGDITGEAERATRADLERELAEAFARLRALQEQAATR